MTRTIAALMLLIAIPMGPVWAADSRLNEKSRAEQKRIFYTEQFAGWGGIILRCLHDKKSEPAKRICENIKTDAEFLAAAAKVPFSLVEGGYFAVALARGAAGSKYSKVPDALVLEANVRVTGTGNIAVAIQFEAGVFYSKAIEQSEKDGPEAMPKGGTLVLWDHLLLAMGQDGNEIYGAVRDGTETILKRFFTLFVKYWTKPKAKKKK